MIARFDHLVVAVEDLDEAAARWTAAGIRAARGGRHPVGTENALVRGPGPAYVELIAAGAEESNPWLDRIRAARGPISWAIAVDDLEAARTSLAAPASSPPRPCRGRAGPPTVRSSSGEVCDIGGRTVRRRLAVPDPVDDADASRARRRAGRGAGPAEPPDPERVADLLLALGFEPSRHWPRRVFDADRRGSGDHARARGGAVDLGPGSWSMGGARRPRTADLARAGRRAAVSPRRTCWTGSSVSTRPDRRRFAASALLPAVDEAFARLRGDLADWPNPHPGGAAPAEHEYSRVTDPERYRLLAVRADAWVEAITAAGLGVAEEVDPATVSWAGEQHLDPTRVTVLRGPGGHATGRRRRGC